MERRPSFFDPDVEQYLLSDLGEFVVDEVVKHPICMVFPTSLILLGVGVIMSSLAAGQFWPLLMVAGFIICCVGLWKHHALSMDRFVITNVRVYRVNGVITRHVATVPLTRILDISTYQSLMGIVFNYGHFTFESAAEEQGLRVITFVGDPKTRDLTIQRVIQRAGLRAMAGGRQELGGT